MDELAIFPNTKQKRNHLVTGIKKDAWKRQ